MTRASSPRLERILARLEAFYGRLPEPPVAAFPHFVWQILWLETSPQARDSALLALRRIPALTPDALTKAAGGRVEAALALAGPSGPDRRRLLGVGCEMFRRHRELDQTLRGSLLVARRSLGWLGQLNPSCAGWMLLFAGGHPVIPLDQRICRVAWRLGWGTEGGPRRRWQRSAKRALADDVGADLIALRRAAHLFAHHGASACADRVPRCGACPLVEDCPRGGT